jgi:hypothetical protein
MASKTMEISELSFPGRQREGSGSGVSWSAVIGGAVVAAALSLIMLALGAGFGLSEISPWSNVGAKASTVGSVAIVWLIVTQLIASSMGGYLTGRLRTRWHSIHDDEVHFRDTANGFLSWALTVVVTVGFLATAAVSMVGDTPSSNAPAASYGQTQTRDLLGTAYFVDRLFRSDHPSTSESDVPMRAEAGRIFVTAMRPGGASPFDTAYLAQIVAARTGLDPGAAARRVSDTVSEARQVEDNARKATAHLLLWIFLALLMGAFSSSFAATVGGRQRDHVQIV